MNRKLICIFFLKKIHSHLSGRARGLNLAYVFTFVPSLSMRAAMDLTGLGVGDGLSEPSLLAYAKIPKYSELNWNVKSDVWWYVFTG